MAGGLARQLDDVLSQIGFHGGNAVGLEMGVQLHLFRHHGFALDDQTGLGLLQDA